LVQKAQSVRRELQEFKVHRDLQVLKVHRVK
jgi:hypothetical protein